MSMKHLKTACLPILGDTQQARTFSTSLCSLWLLLTLALMWIFELNLTLITPQDHHTCIGPELLLIAVTFSRLVVEESMWVSVPRHYSHVDPSIKQSSVKQKGIVWTIVWTIVLTSQKMLKLAFCSKLVPFQINRVKLRWIELIKIGKTQLTGESWLLRLRASRAQSTC